MVLYVLRQTGQPFITGDCYAQKVFDKSVDQGTGFRTESMICVPIFSRQTSQTTAVLSAINRRPDGSPMTPEPDGGTVPVGAVDVIPFDDDDVHVLKTFAMQVGPHCSFPVVMYRDRDFSSHCTQPSKSLPLVPTTGRGCVA